MKQKKRRNELRAVRVEYDSEGKAHYIRNEIRAVRWVHKHGTDGELFFFRTHRTKKYVPQGPSKTRFFHAMRRYAMLDYRLIPSFNGWVLVVRG